jgi:hypothetical protein
MQKQLGRHQDRLHDSTGRPVLGHLHSACHSGSSEPNCYGWRACACRSSLALDTDAHASPVDATATRETLPGIVCSCAELGGYAVPAGMLLLIEQYPWPVAGAAVTRSVFTWFLTSAPAEALVSLSVPEPRSLGRILIDTALVTSKALGLDGQMWLHAAPGGGARLAHFYGTICHMPAFPVGMALPRRRRSDGRYFYAIRSLANQLVQALKLVR